MSENRARLVSYGGPRHLPSRRELREEERKRASSPWTWVKEITFILVTALVVSTLLRIFLVQIFWIPSASMKPTLQENDRIAVSRISSWTGNITRGDIVVFDDVNGWLPQQEKHWWTSIGEFVGLVPAGSGQTLVKRVIGVGGDTVACCNAEGQLTVNGSAIREPYLASSSIHQQEDQTFAVTVPKGYVWVMGDNRSNSADSRYHFLKGDNPFIPAHSVVGKAVAVMWPLNRWTILSGREVFATVP
ncbi:signal peptidase I [Schaalia sp. lx-260]|uniref:signal peptidase I n=1 Tax=Schaalia sp. lx-260 TaxID=2899082 RepID=UPI001E5BAB9B|nr:signal peptidase I [Schaalia sp. lx-260]MCD4549310.1 signal peptidase I [Schaalia sp. lx-260]